MTGGRCCTGGARRRGLARRFSGAAASMLAGTVLLSLPKCPLCLAAWLTVATGIGVPAAIAARVRGVIAILCVSAVAAGAAQIIGRRGFTRSSDTVIRPKRQAV